jgi:hypothetical protein
MWLIKYRNSRVSDPCPIDFVVWRVGHSGMATADDHGAKAVLVSGLNMWALDAARAEQRWGYLLADSLGQHTGEFTGDVLRPSIGSSMSSTAGRAGSPAPLSAPRSARRLCRRVTPRPVGAASGRRTERLPPAG